MAMYEVGTVMGAASQARVTGATTKWSQEALGILPGSILVVYRSGSADLYAIKSVDSDTQLTLTRISPPHFPVLVTALLPLKPPAPRRLLTSWPARLHSGVV